MSKTVVGQSELCKWGGGSELCPSHSPTPSHTLPVMLLLLSLLLTLTTADDASFHHSLTTAALERVGRELVMVDPQCVAALAGLDPALYAHWPLTQLAIACQITTDWRNLAEALDQIAWASATPAILNDRFASISLYPDTNMDPDTFRETLLRLRALAWKLVERGDIAPAREKLGLYLHALQSFARLAVRRWTAAKKLLDAFTTAETASLGLHLLIDSPQVSSEEEEMARAEKSLASQISEISLVAIGSTAKERWDLSKNYSGNFRDSMLLDVMGLWQRQVGILVDIPCAQEEELGVRTLLGTVIEEGFLGLCLSRTRIWILRTMKAPKFASVSIAGFQCSLERQEGLTYISSQVSKFLRDVCENQEPAESKYKAIDGTLTLLNSIGSGGRVFVLTDADRGLLSSPDILEAFEVLAAARELRVDVFMAGTQAAVIPMVPSGNHIRRFFNLAKSLGGLYVPLHTDQPLSIQLLKVVGGTLNDRRIVFDGIVSGQLNSPVEAGSKVHVLIHCTSVVTIKLNDNERSVRFLSREMSESFYLSIIVSRGASCYAQVFYTLGGLSTPLIQVLDDAGVPLFGKSLSGQSFFVALKWQQPPTNCRLSWAADENSNIRAQTDCFKYNIDSLPSEPDFLRVKANIDGSPIELVRILPVFFSRLGSNRPNWLSITPKEDVASTAPPLLNLKIDSVLGLPFGKAVAQLKVEQTVEVETWTMLIASHCKPNNTWLTPASIQSAQGPKDLFIPLATEACSSPNIAQLICLQLRKKASPSILASGPEERWFVCTWLAHSPGAPPAASMPSLSFPNIGSNQRPESVCNYGVVNMEGCELRKWYLELAAPAVDRVQFRTWPANSSTAITDLIIRPLTNRLKLEGTCCIRNVTIYAASLASSMTTTISFSVDPWFNWFPGPQEWTLWKILFALFCGLFGLLAILILLYCSYLAALRRRPAPLTRSTPQPTPAKLKAKDSFSMKQTLPIPEEQPLSQNRFKFFDSSV